MTPAERAACLAAAEAATPRFLIDCSRVIVTDECHDVLDGGYYDSPNDVRAPERPSDSDGCTFFRRDVADAAMAAAYARGADVQDVLLAWQVSAIDELVSLRNKLDEATAAADAAETDRDTQRLAADDWASRFDQAAAKLAEAAARAERAESALRKVRVACQYTGKNPILFVAVDVKAIVDSALAGVPL